MDIIRRCSRKECMFVAKLPDKIGSRKKMRLVDHNNAMINSVKLITRVCKMKNRGWNILNYKDDIPEIFQKMICDHTSEDKCPICLGEYPHKYAMKLQCCGKMMCSSCLMGYTMSEMNKTKIGCPLCRQNLFPWITTWKN